MIEDQLGPWRFKVDPMATRRVYAGVEPARRGSEECGCLACQNFLRAWSYGHPEELQQLLTRLGIDPKKETEVIHYGDYGEDPSYYSWWFHFVGELDEDTEWGERSGTWDLTPEISVLLSKRRDLAWEGFGEQPLVQVELFAHLPWLVKKRPAES